MNLKNEKMSDTDLCSEGDLGFALANSLDFAVTALLGLCVALRPFSAGQPACEPETAFIGALVWFCALVWVGRKLCAGELSLPKTWAWLPLFAFALATAAAVWRTTVSPGEGVAEFVRLDGRGDGNFQAAYDMGLAWAADLILCVMIADHCSRRENFNFICACLLGGLAAVSVYALFQRGYGLEYLRHTLEADSSRIGMLVGNDETHRRIFDMRLGSNRVSGPFGYANALAGFVLLLAPLAVCAWRGAGKTFSRWLMAGVIFVSLMSLVYSGSKAGVLVAKAAEAGLLLLLLEKEKRTGRNFLDIVSLEVLLTGAGIIFAGVVYLLTKSSGATTTAFGLAWFVEAALLARFGESGKILPRVARLGGLAALALGAVLAGYVLAGNGLDGDGKPLPGTVAQARREVWKNLDVRVNYWRAATAMSRDHFWRGVGLDNFGSCYTSYKTPDGWAVRRAHNQYLQLLADGGIFLLLSFCAAVAAVLWSGKKVAVVTYDPVCCQPRQYRRLGYGLCAAVFLLTYGFYPSFIGLSYEYILNELFGTVKSGSFLAESGSPWALLLCALVHLLILPVVWIAAFAAGWKILGEFERLRPFLMLAFGAVALHVMADFYLYSDANSMLFWCLGGLLIASGSRGRFGLRLSPKTGTVLAALFLVAGFWLFREIPLAQLRSVLSLKAAELTFDNYQSPTNRDTHEQDWKDAQAAAGEVLALRPGDSDFLRRYGDLLTARLLELAPAQSRGRGVGSVAPELTEELLSVRRRRVATDPHFASGYAEYARTLRLLYPDDGASRETALRLFGEAAKLHPWRPLYRLQMARLYLEMGRRETARRYYREALDVNNRVGDERAKLSEEELKEAREYDQLLSR